MTENGKDLSLRHRQFSVGSERELDDLAIASQSGTSVQLKPLQTIQNTMAEHYDHEDDDTYLDMYRAGTSKPPHHHLLGEKEKPIRDTKNPKQSRGTDSKSSTSQPSSPFKRSESKEKSFNQWSIDATENSDTASRGSPSKRSSLPQVETVGNDDVLKGGDSDVKSDEAEISRGPRYSSQKSYSEMIDNMSGNDPFNKDYEPSGKHRSKIPKKKKQRQSDTQATDSYPLSHVPQEADKEPKKLKKKKSRHHGSESLNSTATYTVEEGIDNEAYEHTNRKSGKSKRKNKLQIVEDRVSNATYTLSDVEQESQGLKESFSKIISKMNPTKVQMNSKPAKNHQFQHDMMNERKVAKYIIKNIEQRECRKYARNKNSASNKCQCGRSVDWHEEQGIPTPPDSEHDIWAMKTHTSTMPCDSFGEIVFRGFGHDVTNSPYVRLCPITDLEKIWTILTELWDLPIPKLLISVTGGAKRFDLKPRLRNLLKEGLCHAAASTGAWIITGGTSAGVMEFVGEAVRDHIAAAGSNDQNKIVALGIATWGIVANKLALDGEGDKGLFPAVYAAEDVEMTESGTSPLDHNHTHFLLVDDGTEGKFGAEIKMRTMLESYISQKVETGVTQIQSVHVPNVLIVVEGGVNTMKTVSESIQRNTPVVVIEGSGRAAEYIALGYSLTKGRDDEEKTIFPKDFNSIMISRARSMFVWKSKEDDLDGKLHECLRHLRICLEQRRLINVFNLEKADSNKDIDRAILYALLKANKSNANSQLALALAWNRCDIARQEIFNPSNRKHSQRVNLYDAMVTALVQDRADFVQLFIDNGVDIKRFLTIETLWNLYANLINDMGDSQSEIIRNLLAYHKQTWASYLCCQPATRWQQSSDLLKYIGKVIMNLLHDQAMCLYSDEKYVVTIKEGPCMSWLGDRKKIKPLINRLSTKDVGNTSRRSTGQMTARRTKLKMEMECDFKNPEKELFLWAVLFNRRQMAHVFWKIGKDHLVSGLVACALLKTLSEVADDEEELELSADLQNHADLFEKQSIDVLSECYGRDKPSTHQLLICEQREWGNATIFGFADANTLMNFVEHSACQTKLNDIWKGRMALYTPETKIVVTILLPFLLPFIKFTSNTSVGDMLEGEDSDNEEYVEDVVTPGRADDPTSKGNQIDPSGDDDDDDAFTRSRSRRKKKKRTKLYRVNLMDFSRSNINIFTAIFYFYAAPVTKFYCNVGAYLAFLCIFSYFVLIDLYPAEEANSPSVLEIITWIWLSTMLLEEGRQIFIRDQRSLLFKLRSWFSSIWNRFDLLIYSLFIVSIVLRYNLFTSNFIWARMSYSVTLAFFYLRFMQFFFASKNMGPKVIMIRKMLTDLMFFFFILLVFVVSFGVAYHVNMYPNHVPTYKVLINVLYLPYWQMYGELFLERVEGDDDPSGCTRNETLWRNDLAVRCPERNALVTLLLAVYMILTNILLVNLLIAMFSYTFQVVQDNSQKIWRFYRLSLVYEYFDRPTLAPPIIILNHLYRLFMWLVNRSCGTCKRLNSFKERLSDKDYARLRLFERAAMNNYLSRSMMMQREQLDNRVASTAERIENVMYELALIKENVMEKGQQGVLTEEQRLQLSKLDAIQPHGDRPSTGETAYLRQCVDDLTEQMGQHTLKLSQMMRSMEQLVDRHHKLGSSGGEERHRSHHRSYQDGLVISDVSPTDEEQ